MNAVSWLILCMVVTAGAVQLVRYLQRDDASPPLPGLTPRSFPDSNGLRVLHGLEQSPWAVLAAQRGWRMETQIMMGTVGRLDIHLPRDAVSVSVTGHAGAPPGAVAHTTLRLPTPDPGAALADRETLSGLLGQMGRQLDPAAHQSWLPELPGPQGLSYHRGQLTLALPLHIDQLPKALAGLRTLAHAMELARFPPWAKVALKHGWPLTLTATGPMLTASLKGFEIKARLLGQTESLRCTLRCVCPEGVPALTLNHIEHGHGEPEAVPHLIANTLLHIRALDPQGLGKDLHDEALFQAILTVVHGYPGSSLTQKRIELVSPGDLGIGLEEALVAVAELAQALEGRAWNSGRS
jgi:hypothetical protein